MSGEIIRDIKIIGLVLCIDREVRMVEGRGLGDREKRVDGRE